MGRRIGLTGGIACGKSTVGDWLIAQGLPVIDADAVVHELLARDAETLQWVRDRFGDGVMATGGGGVDRQALGTVIFGEPDRRRELEGWLHPRVRERVAQFFAEHAGQSLAVAMVPLIYETKTEGHYDEVWVVAADEAIQLERLMQHRGLSEADALARITSQLPIADKVARADRMFWNNTDRASLFHQLHTILG